MYAIDRINLLHVAVANTWLGEPPTLAHEVNHKNGIKTQCQLSNLEYAASAENNTHAIHILGRKPNGNRAHALTPEEKDTIKTRALAGEKQTELAKEYNITQSRISGIVREGMLKRERLTDNQVREIRERRAAGENPTRIAPDFSVTRQQVTRIGLRQCFSDVQ